MPAVLTLDLLIDLELTEDDGSTLQTRVRHLKALDPAAARVLVKVVARIDRRIDVGRDVTGNSFAKAAGADVASIPTRMISGSRRRGLALRDNDDSDEETDGQCD